MRTRTNWKRLLFLLWLLSQTLGFALPVLSHGVERAVLSIPAWEHNPPGNGYYAGCKSCLVYPADAPCEAPPEERSAHLYAFVANNPYGAVDPLGLDLWSPETGRDASGSHWLWGDQHWLYGNTDWSGLDYVDYSAPYRSSSGYSSSYYSYFDSGSAWDFSNPYDTIDYLSFDYRFTDTRDAISSARQSLWDAVPVLGGVKSFSEMVFGTQWFTGNRVDPVERGIATGIASVGFGALALEGFASRAAFTPAYVPFAAPSGPRWMARDFVQEVATRAESRIGGTGA
ncbi:MAG: pre-toxin TG domain-containing protein, partial [Acidobacteria bacterium]|nr:pre-toxin TG domain-containing protein [Acidobacteriota bacterium]